MANYKHNPRHFYGLNASQMEMFMTEDSPVSRQAEKVTEVGHNILCIASLNISDLEFKFNTIFQLQVRSKFLHFF